MIPYLQITVLKCSMLMGYFFYFTSLLLQGQYEDRNVKTLENKHSQLAVPQKVPKGYISVNTFALSRPLESGMTYEVGFWIIGKQIPTREYSFPITLFLAMDTDPSLISDSEEIEPLQPRPQLEVRPPPAFTARGHFTFIIKPKRAYKTLTIALQKARNQTASHDFISNVKIIGFRLRPSDRNGKREDVKTQFEKRTRKTAPAHTDRRLMDSGKNYFIAEKNVQIGLYDHRNIDQDRVTIYLNDEIIVEKLPLERQKKYFDIELKPGPNTITLHAENLGEVGPNTAAIIIRGTSKEFMAVLESDLGQSQFFTLINTER